MIDSEVVERLVENAPAPRLAERARQPELRELTRGNTGAALCDAEVRGDVVETRGLALQQQIRIDATGGCVACPSRP